MKSVSQDTHETSIQTGARLLTGLTAAVHDVARMWQELMCVRRLGWLGPTAVHCSGTHAAMASVRRLGWLNPLLSTAVAQCCNG